ncbi:hypothetical protein B0O99DRAFT_680891 [Bisporella sp. PMI_857]|nr:hypothetical protein B0O99DRAFT_680891 [Bisporella sp. PMI_857]
MAQNQHTYIDILKIDIEGAEYKSLEAFMDSCVEEKMMPVGQIMIELHLNRETGFEWFIGWWERLESLGMRPTWLEVNLLAITLVQEHSDPGCVEFVLVNSKDERSVLLAE